MKKQGEDHRVIDVVIGLAIGIGLCMIADLIIRAIFGWLM